MRRPISNFRPSIRSRHGSHDILRRKHRKLPLFPFRSLVRLGSTTIVGGHATTEADEATYDVVINPAESIRTSSNKILMKEAFESVEVKTAPWFTANNQNELLQLANHITDNWSKKLVTKRRFGSKGRGNTLVSSEAEMLAAIGNDNITTYIFEQYMPFALEYRLHITKNGCFYTCRKALRQNVPEDQRWRRHDDVCVWFLEENPNFNRPNSWDDIVSDCVKALGAIGADVLSFDVKVQGANDQNGNPRRYQEYILLECNSASSLGSPDNPNEPGVCAQKYIEQLPILIREKYNENNNL